ncbi:MAG: hypothetical protein K9M80_06670, partial [Candidatus Marinimicrobia bacterium]|nr:hypothetical protein [Candidatus Neomarinimicrobiota bacterium]
MLQLFKISTGINQITTLSLSAIKNLISHIIRKRTTARIETIKIFSNIIILLSLLQLFNCNSSSLQIIDSRIVDGKYDNHPPLNNSSKKIKNIFESVAMVHCTAYYTQYELEYSD